MGRNEQNMCINGIVTVHCIHDHVTIFQAIFKLKNADLREEMLLANKFKFEKLFSKDDTKVNIIHIVAKHDRNLQVCMLTVKFHA